jgi:mannose-6-phosphate isomerase
VPRSNATALHARALPDVAADHAVTVADVRARLAAGSDSPRADATVVDLAEQHPGDPGALVSLMLNRVTLEPGESMFVPAGHVHAYLSGCAVEIMSSSDNVLRAGLTTKHVDVDALLACARYGAGPAARPVVRRLLAAGGRRDPGPGADRGLWEYRADIAEFGLVMGVVRPSDGEVVMPGEGPRIVLVLDGELEVEGAVPGRASDGETSAAVVRAGESAFVPDALGGFRVRGAGRLAVAYVP